MNTKVHVNLIDRQRFQKRNFDLVKQHTKKMVVVSVKHEYRNHVVYDFMSEKNHNAFANNGACVHNCTIALQFLVREGELICIAYMRSNDLYYGFRNDVYCFTEMQKMLAKKLEVGIGPYFHIAGSLHLYEKELQKVKAAFGLEDKRRC
jgi:hypothetical protein